MSSFILMNFELKDSNTIESISADIKQIEFLEFSEGKCIYASHRLGGVCSGATTRLCEGPPECKHPPKEEKFVLTNEE